MTWSIVFLKEAANDLQALDNSQRTQIIKAIEKVAQNPLSDNEGGYGKRLGNIKSSKLVGCLKIKLRKLGLRVIYKVVREAGEMKIIVIAARNDDVVYREAERRLKNVRI